MKLNYTAQARHYFRRDGIEVDRVGGLFYLNVNPNQLLVKTFDVVQSIHEMSTME